MTDALMLPNPIGAGLLWYQLLVFQVRHENTRNARDISGYEFVFRIRRPDGSIATVLTEALANRGYLTNGGTLGTLEVNLRAETSSNWAPGRYTFELDGTRSDGQIERFLDGYLLVRPARGLIANSRTTLVTRTTDALLVDDLRDVSVVRVERGTPGPRGEQGEPGSGADVEVEPSLQRDATTERIKLNTEINLEDAPWYAFASTQETTCTTVAGSPLAPLALLRDFAAHQGCFIAGAGAAHTLITPPAPTGAVLPAPPGATSRTYRICGMTDSYGYTARSATVTVTNGPVTLSEAAYIRITPPLIAQVDGVARADIPNLAAFTVAHANRTYVAGERIALPFQTDLTQNGIYVVGAVVAGVAPLTRAADFNSGALVSAASGYFVPVRAAPAYGGGTAGAPRMLQVTSGAVTLGVTPITFSEEVRWICVFVNDARTGGNDRFIGAICTSATWYSASAAPIYVYDDIGLALDGVTHGMPSSAPATASANGLRARIQEINGTVATLDRNAGTSGSFFFEHDNSLAIQEAHDSLSAQGESIGGTLRLGRNASVYAVRAMVTIDKQVRIVGNGLDTTRIGLGAGMGFRVYGSSTARYGSSADGFGFDLLTITGLNTSLVAGGDYQSTPYDGHAGTYTDTRKLSNVQGAVVLCQVRTHHGKFRITHARGNGLVIDGTSDDTGANTNNTIVENVDVTSLEDQSGFGVLCSGYDSSNSFIFWVHSSGTLGICDNGFTGSNWLGGNLESCYSYVLVPRSTSRAVFMAMYMEGGPAIGARLRRDCNWFGGNNGAPIAAHGAGVFVGNTIFPGVVYAIAETPDRIFTQLGTTAANATVWFQQWTEETAGEEVVNWGWRAESNRKQFGRWYETSTYMIDAICPQEPALRGGLLFERGFLMGGNTTRRVVHMVNGVPGTSLNRIFRPGDVYFESASGITLRPRVKCVSTTNDWAAGGHRVGDVIVPTTNNTKNRGFVVTVAGTSGSQPNWDTVADDANVADGSVTWNCWGATGSGTPQWHFYGPAATLALANQNATIAATTLAAAPAAGLYRVSVCVEVTTAGAAGTVDATIGWTDRAGATTNGFAGLSLAALGRNQVTFLARANGSNNFTYATTVVGGAGSVYALSVTAERIGE